jgi:CheY-like chemotaxis protein
LRFALEHAGYRVIEACDGEEGLEVIARQGDELALVVADQRMRRISGLEILRQVRRRPHRIPVVLMSGYPSLDPPDGMEGPDAFLRKPFELLDLARTVQRLIVENSARA